jgi:hypothetical protein
LVAGAGEELVPSLPLLEKKFKIKGATRVLY